VLPETSRESTVDPKSPVTVRQETMPHSGIVTSWHMSFPSESTRVTSPVSVPTPLTVALTTDPPVDPIYGVMARIIGSREIPASMIEWLSGIPSSK
jgi:hypothetical protein